MENRIKVLWLKLKCFLGLHTWEQEILGVYLDEDYLVDVKYKCQDCGETVIIEKHKFYA